MVLQKDYDTVARWGADKWIIEAQPRYRWTDIKGRIITDWYNKLEDALQFAVESSTKLGAAGTRNQDQSVV
jgi:hypothetical protein